ncbi:MAG: hypothetical protein MJZ49_00385 [Bacteroidales bacterium]|nr:hypothetical protein [Bacteroidales bacterium]
MDIGIFWLGLVLFLIIIFRSNKKKKTSPPPQQQRPSEAVFNSISEDEDFQHLRKNQQKCPKNEEDFSYENISDEDFENLKEENVSQSTTVEKNIQSVDNEQTKNIDLQFNMEEIKKGIIYSEILKRPDF